MQPSDEPEELELDPFVDDDTSSLPDSPLLIPITTQPKWLSADRNIRHRWWHSATTFLADILRPRRSWRYILCATLSAYAIACFARGVPLLASPLPRYTGPHHVGAVDVEIPLDRARRISDTVFRTTGQPAFGRQTTLFTVYYPVASGTREKSARHPWIARPISVTAEGYAKFAGVNSFITRPIFTFALWAIAGGVSIPANVDAPLLEVGAGAGAAAGGEAAGERLPVMVFSHGDASSRTDYTNYIGELASRGYVVAAIEHRDGSCPGSVMKIKGHKDRHILTFKEKELESDPPLDTTRYKQDQLAFRDDEIFETIKILRAINDGKGRDVFALNSRGEGTTLHDWAGRLDFDNLVIGGHSFGATGALQALKSAPSATNPAIGGVILDPGKSSGQLNHDINVPILVVHSNSWSKQHSIFFGRPHFDTVKDLVLDVLRRVPSHASWFLTSLGTSHPSVTDAPLLEPLLLSWTTGASLNTKQALKEYVRVTVDFWHFLRTSSLAGDADRDGNADGELRGVLAEKTTHEQYGQWVSREREREFVGDIAEMWEVHVSPVSDRDKGSA